METLYCEQGSELWRQAKLGIVSSSNFSKVLCKGTGRKLYMRKVAGEKLSGIYEETYSNKNMEKGLELESSAREYYEAVNHCVVEQVGFIKRNDWVGASPDGLIGEPGGLEIKCVIPSTHIDNCIKDKLQTCYVPQVQGLLWVSERKWWDCISYCPAITSRPYFCVRVFRDEEYIKELAIQITMFVSELKKMIEKLTVSEF